MSVHLSCRLALVLTAVFTCVAADAAPTFRLPLDCAGGSCIIQNFADVDAGPGAKDIACGPLTYEGHDGLDFRVTRSRANAGVPVLAPAAGIVRSVRDGETDGAYLAQGHAALNGRDCGNGVVIEHEGGFSSQLCHMRKGSLRVAPGVKVTAGQPVGMIGLSGFTQFPHVHLTLRRADTVIEPIGGTPLAQAKCTTPPPAIGSLWAPEARDALTYRGARWFVAGFTGAPGAGDPEAWPVAVRSGPALAFWALAVGPRAGDVLRLRLFAPDGAMVAESQRVQERDQAQAWLYAGRKTPPAGWPAGRYRAEAVLQRGGAIVDRREQALSF